MIEYFRLNIEDLRFAFGLRPVGVYRAYAPEGRSIIKDLKKKRQSDTRRRRLRCENDFHKYSIFNLQSSIPVYPG